MKLNIGGNAYDITSEDILLYNDNLGIRVITKVDESGRPISVSEKEFKNFLAYGLLNVISTMNDFNSSKFVYYRFNEVKRS